MAATPIRRGPSAGIFALAFRGQQHGFAVGGDFATPATAPDSLAPTSDGGATWQRIDSGSFDTVDCASRNACWAAGEQGRAAHLVATH